MGFLETDQRQKTRLKNTGIVVIREVESDRKKNGNNWSVMEEGKEK